MLFRYIALAAVSGVVAAAGTVKLSVTSPATVYAGVTSAGVTGFGFPAGLAASGITVALAPTCNGSPVTSTKASSVANLSGTAKRVSFTPPSSTPAGKFAVSVSGSGFNTGTCSSVTVTAAETFVKAASNSFMLNGAPFRFGGTNAWTIAYSDQSTVDQVLATAAANDFRALRVSAWEDIGKTDGTGSINGPQNGIYFQYWTGSAPAYNDGSNGIQHLDYAIYKAGKMGLKLILNFTDNWANFGGMDQYVKWAGDQYHDQFYTDPKIVRWYESYISHLLNRVNPLTGIAYKNDPAIMMWELANEPRCSGTGPSGGGFSSSSSCTTAIVTNWVMQVSAYVKSIDSNHLLAVGDEGFFCDHSAGSSDWLDNCSQGVDTVAFTQVPSVDAMGYHLYPDSWGQTLSSAEQFVTNHITSAEKIGKPSYLGEYGELSGNIRTAVYKSWTDTVLTSSGATGALFWDLGSGTPGANAAESANGFDVFEGAPILALFKNFSHEIAANTTLPLAPVADNQWATVNFNQPGTLSPLRNDVAYAGATINPNSIDLDPASPGQQTSISVYGGEFQVSGSTVQFKPTPGFNGNSQASYTVSDSHNNVSNVAFLGVAVKPSEGAVLNLESFETGTDGWRPINSGSSTVSQKSTFHTDGNFGLQVVTAKSDWVGFSFGSPISLANRPSISMDVESTALGGGAGISIQSGSAYAWCQSQSFTTLPSSGLATLTIPLDPVHMQCFGTPDFTNVEAIWIFLPGGGTFYLDYLRAGAVTNPTTQVTIESFETGIDGWKALNGDGTLSQESSFATDGTHGLTIASAAATGDWFGVAPGTPLNLTGKTKLQYDIQTNAAGTSLNFAIQSGNAWTWCQGNNWGFENANQNGTVTLDLTQTSCVPDLSQIHALWIYFSNGTYQIDNVRAQ